MEGLDKKLHSVACKSFSPVRSLGESGKPMKENDELNSKSMNHNGKFKKVKKFGCIYIWKYYRPGINGTLKETERQKQKNKKYHSKRLEQLGIVINREEKGCMVEIKKLFSRL